MAAVVLQIAHPSGVAAGWAVGLAAASFVHLVLGSPGGQLTAEQVGEALRDLGVETESVEAGEPRSPGEQLLRARAVGGEDLEVKVFGRDAWDAQYVGSLWSALTRRGEAPAAGHEPTGAGRARGHDVAAGASGPGSPCSRW